MKKLKLLSLVLAMVMVLSFALTSCGGADSTSGSGSEGDVVSNATYTYNGATSSLPTSWNSHTYTSNDATTVTGYTTDSLYTFDYNDTKDGYQIVPAMATDFPTDVTEQYVGRFGIEEEDANRVYSIPLRDDLKFDNGDPITAATFVESMKLLLNPEAANYRADSYFTGNLILHGARDYALQGSVVLVSAVGQYETLEDAIADTELFFDIESDNTFFASYYGSMYPSYKHDTYKWAYLIYAFGAVDHPNKILPLQGKTVAEIYADAELKAVYDILVEWWDEGELGFVEDFFGTLEPMPEYAWEDVGFFADGNNLIVVNDLELSGFYLKYALSGDFFLIHPETYKNCISDNQGVYSNSYGTSADTYVGFGPYKLDTYVNGNIVTFVRNEYWYGYNDQQPGEGYYQTTNIVIKQVADSASRLEMFLQGKLDSYGLEAADMEDYQSSDYTYYTDGDSTWFVALNPDMDGLTAAQETATEAAGHEVNKTILTIKEFRQALSFSIDRQAYALKLDPLGATAKALYGNMIISDPENGTAYRTTEEAKDAILKFWGLYDQVGEGKRYATKDEAIDSITGYDLAGAKELFDTAYDKAVEQGLITDTENFTIELVIGQPGSGSSAYYNNGYEHLAEVWTNAVVGTKLEGKLKFTQSQPLGSSNFAEFLHNNQVDILFGVGWTGSVLDPYGLMSAYVNPDQMYDPGWNTKAEALAIEIDGQVLSASIYDWVMVALSGIDLDCYVVVDGEVTEETVTVNAGANADISLRLAILAAVEEAVLLQYDMIPINLDASANLKGMKITYGTEEYVFGVGRGGTKYMTYNFTDEEWDAFVEQNDGTLNYL